MNKKYFVNVKCEDFQERLKHQNIINETFYTFNLTIQYKKMLP